jgi:dUTP pyrophosphatase
MSSAMMCHSLCIYVQTEDLYREYCNRAEDHNSSVIVSEYFDAGFDLLTPEAVTSFPGDCVKINTQVVATLHSCRNEPMCFYMYPRSSISKTPLRLANSVGIIDSGYRGTMVGVFDHLPHYKDEYHVTKHSRLLQVCSPNLEKMKVTIIKVNNFDDLSKSTKRGSGGFGSTGV